MHRIILTIGPVTIYSYGLFVALSFLVSGALIYRDMRKKGYSGNDILDGLFWVVTGGLIGGRALFVAVNLSYFVEAPVKVLFINQGGLAIQGAIAGGILAWWIVSGIKKMSFLDSADIAAPYIALGQAIGRIGCFMNGCCYGKITTGFFGFILPGETVGRHPSPIYFTIGLLVIYILLKSFSRLKLPKGWMIFLYLLIYSLFRFIMGFLRDDNVEILAGLKLTQLIAVISMALICALGVFVLRGKKS